MKRIIFLATLALFGCQLQATQVQRQNKQITPNVHEVSAKQIVTSEFLISTHGIGKAKFGMTLGQLKEISGKDTEFNPIADFTSDLNAIAVRKNGLDQYYILYPADSDQFMPSDQDVIRQLITNNYNYQTEEGVKVGTQIRDAEAIYGDAILAYNVDGESVEYISFGNYEPQNIRFKASYFKLISDGLGFAGIYPEYPGVAYTTDKYQSDAAIASIEVSCDQDTCPQ